MTASPTIECWFDFASSYSDLSVMRIERDAAALGMQVLWRPLLLGPVLQAQGWPMPPFVQQPAQARGVFGAPTFFGGDEMFWGDDRLDDALARAAGQS